MQLEGAVITWLGHATFLVETPGKKTIVMDPWLTENPKCPDEYRTLDKADIILISHGHFDHMGSAADLAKRTGALVVSNFEIGSFLASQGVENTVGMNKGGTVTVGDIKITMVHADHSSGISAPDGSTVYGGEASGFVVTLENGLTLYHAGDTNVFADMSIIHELYAPDVAMLPIGGHFTMSPKEAAYAVKLLKPKMVIPMHYGTFDALTGTPEALKDLLAGQPVEIEALQPGGQCR
ncbi:MAG: metal-dependent hydrolase [Firmicutes bacterium]|nr:metal-dependent hydrolase [Bacillota bacterium]